MDLDVSTSVHRMRNRAGVKGKKRERGQHRSSHCFSTFHLGVSTFVDVVGVERETERGVKGKKSADNIALRTVSLLFIWELAPLLMSSE
jgi:hypothetical protein